MKIPADTVDGALEYLTVILAGIPFAMLYNLGSALLQAVGNSVMPLLFLLFSNVVLDLLFMGPLAMRVRGAAIATIVSLAVTLLAAPAAVHAITGSESEEVIRSAVLYLKINVPMIPPMAVLVILRSTLQGMRHTVAPLLCSSLELIGKVIFALWIVPVRGYMAVCVCEPILWAICCVFILAAAFMCRKDFRDVKEGEGI